MNNAIQVRADVVFQFSDQSFHPARLTYQYQDFIVRVEKETPLGKQVRYGILVDFPDDGGYWQKCYIVEIPVEAAAVNARQQAQEALINQYIDEMREKFQQWHYEQTNAVDGMTIDAYDKLQRRLKSVDGRWNLYRQFRENHLVPFSQWLLNQRFDDPEARQQFLVRNRMTFEVDEGYLISVDWPAAYICYEQPQRVAHFKDGQGDDKLFRPFHNYAWQKEALATRFSVQRDYSYSSVYKEGFTLKPNNYTLFAFYCQVVDQICKLQHENAEEIKHYHTYVQNLSAIEAILMKHGPLQDVSSEQLEALLAKRTPDWDGDTADHDNREEHLAHFAWGLSDLIEAKNMFSDIIYQESIAGRNKDRSMDIEILARSLCNAFLLNEQARACHEDLWAFNFDQYGIDLFTHKILSVLCTMKDAELVYNEFLKAALYEHPILDDPKLGHKDHAIDPEHWGNLLYRSGNILTDVMVSYYGIREEVEQLKRGAFFYEKVVPDTPHTGQIDQWLMDNVVRQQDVSYQPGYKADASTAPQNYTRWRLNDEQVRKLANYLAGGNKIEQLKGVEASLAKEIYRIFGQVDFKALPNSKISELHARVLELKENLINDVPELRAPSAAVHGLNFGLAGLNLLMSSVVMSNAYSEDENAQLTDSERLEKQLRAWSMMVGVFSDIGNAFARTVGIEATLVRASAGYGVRGAVSVGLGRLQILGGGVGGVLGFIWFAMDARENAKIGFHKDAILDRISAVACLLGTASLFTSGTAVGVFIGVACGLASFALVLMVQIVKYFKLHMGDVERLCKTLFGSALPKGGMDRLRAIEPIAETDDRILKHFEKEAGASALLDKVKRFIDNWDTFDLVEREIRPVQEWRY